MVNDVAPAASVAVVKGQRGAGAGAKEERSDGGLGGEDGLGKIGLGRGVKKPRKRVLVGPAKI